MTKNTITIGFVVFLLGLGGGVLGTYSWLRDATTVGDDHHGEEGHREDHHDNFERGPHGGRWLSANLLSIEITIFERGVPPQFRLYPFDDGKPIESEDIDIMIQLHRLGGHVDVISFQREGEYFRGDKVVEEPHSFDVEVTAEWRGESYYWRYSTYEGRVVLSAEAAQQAGIEVREAAAGRIAKTKMLRGEIALNADEVAHIVPRVSGQVREVFGFLGDDVQAGDVLAVIDSRELAQAKAGDLAAEAKLSLMRASLERVEKLFEKKIAPEEELLKARQELAEAEIGHRTAEAKLRALGLTKAQVRALHEEKDVDYSRYEIRAPFDGVVIEKHLTLGEVVGPDSNVFLLADLTDVWVNLTVYQKDLASVRIGQAVTVSVGADIVGSGFIDYVSSVVDQATRTATARVVLENKDRQLRPGIFVTAELVEYVAVVPVAITAEAILTIRDWSAVFVNVGDTFEARPLELGRSDGRWIEVLHGLLPGDKYVAKNSFVLKAEVGKSGATHSH